MDKNEKWNKNEDSNSYMFYTRFPVTDIKWDGASRNNKLLSTCLEETVFSETISTLFSAIKNYE